jgi:hypothetical protein
VCAIRGVSAFPVRQAQGRLCGTEFGNEVFIDAFEFVERAKSFVLSR